MFCGSGIPVTLVFCLGGLGGGTVGWWKVVREFGQLVFMLKYEDNSSDSFFKHLNF